MLSISPPMTRAALEKYFQKLLQQSYYDRDGDDPGRWGGEGAACLGLTGTVQRKQFGRLLDGLSPDGRLRMVQNAQSPRRQSGWDMTFSAPKSVSVFWAITPKVVRRVTEACHRRAVEKALRYAEQRAGITRRGKGGAIKERAKLVFASFEHCSSRANDPQLHTHNVLLNLCVRADGTTGTLQSRDIFRLKIALGEFYRKELAAELRTRLGLTIEFDKVGFRIVGVPQTLCRNFSKRRRAVEKRLQETGEHGAVAAKQATLETRPHKKDIPRATLLPAWQEEAAQHGWTQAQAVELIPPDKRREFTSAQLVGDARSEKSRETLNTPASSLSPASEGKAATPESTRLPESPRSGKESRELGQDHHPTSGSQPLPASSLDRPRQSEKREGQDLGPTKHASPRETLSAKPQRGSDLTGFENYPDFVGPVAPNAARRERSASEASPSGPQAQKSKNIRPEPEGQARQDGASPRHGSDRESSSAKAQRDSDLTGFENYPDFVGPVAPNAARRERSASEASPSGPQAQKSKNLRPEPEGQGRQEGASPRHGSDREPSSAKAQRDSDRTGFEDYPDFVGPIAQEKTRTRRESSQASGSQTGRASESQGSPNRRRWWSKLPKPYVGVEWRRAFPHAPSWSPASKWQVPVMVAGVRWPWFPREPYWGRILWRLDVGHRSLLVQQRRVFPKAPRWSPIQKLRLPVVCTVSNVQPPPRQQTMYYSH